MRYLNKLCRMAVEEDRAEYGDALEQEFGIKVIDPAFLAVAWAEMAARLNLRPSRRSYGSVGTQEEV